MSDPDSLDNMGSLSSGDSPRVDERYPFRVAWRKATDRHRDGLTQIVAALSNTNAAIDVLKRLTSGIPEACASADMHDAIQTAQAGSAELDEILREMIPPQYLNSLHGSRHFTTATTFFDIAEITEVVCRLLPLPDLLSMQRVSKRIAGTIEGSPKLQSAERVLSDYEIQIHDDYSFDMTLAADVLTTLRLSYVSALFQHTTDDKPHCSVYIDCGPHFCTRTINPGAGLRKLLIFSPSLIHLDAKLGCCREGEPERITNRTGITIGDLYDHHHRMQAGHRTSARKKRHRRNEDGSLKTTVEFEGRLPPHIEAKCLSLLRRRTGVDLALDAVHGVENTECVNDVVDHRKLYRR